MDFIQQLSLFGLIISFFFGQLLRVTLFGINFPVIDIFIIILALYNFTRNYRHIQNRYLLIFIIYSWINLAANLIVHNYNPIAPVSYLLRLTALLSFFIYFSNSLVPPKAKNFFELILLSNVIFGLLQYTFWPDLTYLKAVGWDDHLNRLVSTFFDPTFTGLIYLLFLINLVFRKRRNWWLISTVFLGIALTYSRATFLSLLICSLFAAFSTKRMIWLLSFGLICLAVIFLPRLEGEGTRLERTSSIFAKVENYKEGWRLFKKSPIFGYGYNNLSNLRPATAKNLHSRAAYDSSLLTVLVTSGAIGFLIFIFGIASLFRQLDPVGQTMWVAVLIHSLFANSLLYPWVLICLVFFKYRK